MLRIHYYWTDTHKSAAGMQGEREIVSKSQQDIVEKTVAIEQVVL